MAYVTLQDASGMMDVVVFPSTLAEVYQHLQQNTMVLAEGRCKKRAKGTVAIAIKTVCIR